MSASRVFDTPDLRTKILNHRTDFMEEKRKETEKQHIEKCSKIYPRWGDISIWRAPTLHDPYSTRRPWVMIYNNEKHFIDVWNRAKINTSGRNFHNYYGSLCIP